MDCSNKHLYNCVRRSLQTPMLVFQSVISSFKSIFKQLRATQSNFIVMAFSIRLIHILTIHSILVNMNEVPSSIQNFFSGSEYLEASQNSHFDSLKITTTEAFKWFSRAKILEKIDELCKSVVTIDETSKSPLPRGLSRFIHLVLKQVGFSQQKLIW